ncbi:hypothetical protein [Sphingomonas jatrophae]|uniref:Uncharacterized protein n=1 Tax=Sphingomonas jatrophae TaxID=1166337 RepID=A0A1I6L2P1_9SPHN|nr:hypothetical protein [Sphingomonas jatrophae]SFR97711.1 hypothetical protein SAMN05192580_2197 [Sphingomonas jatrophae]
MDALNPTRRALLGSALLAPIATAAVAIPVAAPAVDRSEWDRAKAAQDAAKRAYEAATKPAADATAAYQANPVPVPEKAIKREFWSYAHQDYVLRGLDLDDHEQRIRTDGFGTPESRAKRIADVQAIRDHRAADDALRDRTGYDRLHELSDEACDAWTDAAWEAILTPAPDLSAILWKLEWLFGSDKNNNSSYSIEAIRTVEDDLRRLNGEAA